MFYGFLNPKHSPHKWMTWGYIASLLPICKNRQQNSITQSSPNKNQNNHTVKRQCQLSAQKIHYLKFLTQLLVKWWKSGKICWKLLWTLKDTESMLENCYEVGKVGNGRDDNIFFWQVFRDFCMTKDTSIKFCWKDKGTKAFSVRKLCNCVILALVGSTKRKVGIQIGCLFGNECNLP